MQYVRTLTRVCMDEESEVIILYGMKSAHCFLYSLALFYCFPGTIRSQSLRIYLYYRTGDKYLKFYERKCNAISLLWDGKL